jgi:ubiquinone/menaquinone biosynthesis C-methylase UbiE
VHTDKCLALEPVQSKPKMKQTDRKRTIQDYYSMRAKDYDRQKSRTWKSDQGFEDRITNAITNALASSKNKHVLEVCVGSGRASLLVLEKTTPWFVGLDLSREMLKSAQTKLSVYKTSVDLVLGDTEHIPFAGLAFDGLLCVSAMHYFAHPEKYLKEFSRVLGTDGVFVWGDLTLHEKDDRDFLDKLERTVSGVHERYWKPSEIKRMFADIGFRISAMETVPYRKPLAYLIEDKGAYFGVDSEMLRQCLQSASEKERKLYAINDTELTLYYTLVKVIKEDQ